MGEGPQGFLAGIVSARIGPGGRPGRRLGEVDQVGVLRPLLEAGLEEPEGGLRVVGHGHGAHERRPEAGILTIDRNEAQNLLVLQRCKRLARNAELFAVLRDEEAGVTPTMMAELGANVLFGAPRAVQRWNHRLDDGTATVRWLRVHRALEPAASPWPESHSDPWLPLVVLREGENQAEPITAATALETGDRVAVLVHDPCETEVDAALPVEFTPVEPPPALRAA